MGGFLHDPLGEVRTDAGESQVSHDDRVSTSRCKKEQLERSQRNTSVFIDIIIVCVYTIIYRCVYEIKGWKKCGSHERRKLS